MLPGPKAQSIGRPSIGLERIVAAATLIVDHEGPQALSMRKLADHLESGTATLYRYFQSKDEILVYVVDRVLGEVELEVAPSSSPNWRQVCLRSAEVLYRLLRKHPLIVPLLLAQIPIGPNALMQRERAIAVLLGSGFSAALAARAYSALMHYVLGAARQLGASSPRQVTGFQLRDYYRSLDASAFGATVLVADHLPMISDEEEFHFGLQLVIEGLAVYRRKHTGA